MLPTQGCNFKLFSAFFFLSKKKYILNSFSLSKDAEYLSGNNLLCFQPFELQYVAKYCTVCLYWSQITEENQNRAMWERTGEERRGHLNLSRREVYLVSIFSINIFIQKSQMTMTVQFIFLKLLSETHYSPQQLRIRLLLLLLLCLQAQGTGPSSHLHLMSVLSYIHTPILPRSVFVSPVGSTWNQRRVSIVTSQEYLVHFQWHYLTFQA